MGLPQQRGLFAVQWALPQGRIPTFVAYQKLHHFVVVRDELHRHTEPPFRIVSITNTLYHPALLGQIEDVHLQRDIEYIN